MTNTIAQITISGRDPDQIRQDILNEIDGVPDMPISTAKVIELANTPHVNMGELSKAIELDPGLTLNILRIANSPYYGCSRDISSINQAIVRLGTEVLFQMVMTTSVSPMVSLPVRGYDMPAGALWEHSMAVAIGAECVANILEYKHPDYTFTAGLLHDIGKIILGTFIEIDPNIIFKIAFEENLSFEKVEAQILGIDHAEIGAELLKKWNLPDHIVDIVRCHHCPEKIDGDRLVVDLIHIADMLGYIKGGATGEDGLHYELSNDVVERLKINTEIAEKTICLTQQKLQDAKDLLDLEGV